MNTGAERGSPVVKIVRWVATLIVVAGILEGLLQTNIQKLAEQEGWDKVLADNWHPIMDKVTGMIALQGAWNVFWFCAGVASALWVVRLFPGRSSGLSSGGDVNRPIELGHSLHLAKQGLDVRIDPVKKMVQVGFNLHNSAGIPLRYEVQDMTVVIEGKTVMSPNFSNRGGVVPKDGQISYHFPPIPIAVGKNPLTAEARIVYQYGSAKAGEPFEREAVYGAQVTIVKGGGGPYVMLEENDAKI